MPGWANNTPGELRLKAMPRGGGRVGWERAREAELVRVNNRVIMASLASNPGTRTDDEEAEDEADK